MTGSELGLVKGVLDSNFLNDGDVVVVTVNHRLNAFGFLNVAEIGGHPASGNAGMLDIVQALEWVQGTLLGNLATTAVVIAVAVVGLMMLTGRVDWRRGVTVVLGAFIIFGAAAIVAGIRTALA